MKVKMEKIENNVIKLEITVEAQKFNEAMLKAYKKGAKNFNIAGFRKGKAPMNIIKKHYGEGVFFEDTIDICCDATYPEALKENNINPVDYPKVEIVQIGEGKDFIYNAVITVYPEVEIGQYKGLEVKKVEYTVNEEQVENEIKAMQTKNARIETKEQGTVEKGNIAIIDFKGYVDQVAFEGGEGEAFELEIGSGTFIDTFEEQLIGTAIGENKTVNVTFPAEYGREDLNNKSAVFQVAVKAIKVKELPEIDDEFAKEASEFDTLEELKSDVLKKLEEASNSRAKREFEAAVTDAATENATVEVPEIMVTKEVEGMLKDLEMRLQYQGLDLETYYQYTNNTEAKVKEFMKETAEKRVKTDLVIEKISKLENIEVKEEELLEKANEMSKMYGSKDQEKYAKLIVTSQRESLKTALINEKVVKVLVDSCVAIA